MTSQFKCRYCETEFDQESRFDQHACKQKKRAEEFRSPIGQAALSLYEKWFRSRQLAVPNTATFPKSRYFRTFIKFAEFVKQVNVDPDLYIQFVTTKELQPATWTHDAAFAAYLEQYEYHITPSKQIEASVKTLLKFADQAEVDVKDVLTLIPMPEILHLIRQRKLSPWLLLRSSIFQRRVRDATPEERKILQYLADPKIWIGRFQRNPDIVKIANVCVRELNI